jgi:Uma2 family endonuclease
MAALRKHAPLRMTVAEFLSWDPGDRTGRRWQLIDGEPVAMAPGSETHAALQSETARLIGNHLVARNSRCRVLTELGIVPRIRANRNFRIPDIGVTCAPPSHSLMVSDPVLLIEILSPSNETETRANLWAYTTIPSVKEIVVIHSTRIEAELLRRRDDGSWPEDPDIIGFGGTLALASIDYAVAVAALYRTTVLAAG